MSAACGPSRGSRAGHLTRALRQFRLAVHRRRRLSAAVHRSAAARRFRTRLRALSGPEVVHVHPKDIPGQRGEQFAAEYDHVSGAG
jgi:hypothetical protein